MQVAIFEEDGGVGLLGLLVFDAVDDRVRVDHAAAALVDTFFQEHRVFVGLADPIGGDEEHFCPGLNHVFHRHLRIGLDFLSSLLILQKPVGGIRRKVDLMRTNRFFI